MIPSEQTGLKAAVNFFAVYDGHGGSYCADYLMNNFHYLMLQNPKFFSNTEAVIWQAVQEVDNHMMNAYSENPTN